MSKNNGNKGNLKSEFDSWRVFDKRKEAVESAVAKGFLDNFGYLLIIGGFYPNFPGCWIIPTVYIIIYSFYVFCLLYTTYLSFNDINLMGESLHYAVLFFSTLAEVTTALFNRSQIEHIMRTLGSGVYDYGDTLDEDSINEIKKVTSKAKVNKNFFSKVYIGMIVSAATIISFLKTTVMAFSENNDEFYIKTDGINREMPISCWYPFDHRITYVNVLCHIVQRMAAYFAIAAVIATDILYLCVSEETIAQLKIAGITMRNAVKRAKHVMKSNNDGDMRKCISICLSHSIKHQITILRLIESLRIYYFYLVLVLMSGGAILICLSGFVFTLPHLATSIKVNFLTTLTCELVHIFIYCWYAEEIKQLNSTLNRNEIYDSDWLNYSAEMRYYMLMIVNKSFKPKTLSIGGFAELSMATYANVLSSAYSYFNLLNATK